MVEERSMKMAYNHFIRRSVNEWVDKIKQKDGTKWKGMSTKGI
jgi:hypothetical protein